MAGICYIKPRQIQSAKRDTVALKPSNKRGRAPQKDEKGNLMCQNNKVEDENPPEIKRSNFEIPPMKTKREVKISLGPKQVEVEKRSKNKMAKTEFRLKLQLVGCKHYQQQIVMIKRLRWSRNKTRKRPRAVFRDGYIQTFRWDLLVQKAKLPSLHLCRTFVKQILPHKTCFSEKGKTERHPGRHFTNGLAQSHAGA